MIMVYILRAIVLGMDLIQLLFGGWLLKWKFCWVSMGLWKISVMIWPFSSFMRMSKNGNFFNSVPQGILFWGVGFGVGCVIR